MCCDNLYLSSLNRASSNQSGLQLFWIPTRLPGSILWLSISTAHAEWFAMWICNFPLFKSLPAFILAWENEFRSPCRMNKVWSQMQKWRMKWWAESEELDQLVKGFQQLRLRVDSTMLRPPHHKSNFALKSTPEGLWENKEVRCVCSVDVIIFYAIRPIRLLFFLEVK